MLYNFGIFKYVSSSWYIWHYETLFHSKIHLDYNKISYMKACSSKKIWYNSFEITEIKWVYTYVG